MRAMKMPGAVKRVFVAAGLAVTVFFAGVAIAADTAGPIVDSLTINGGKPVTYLMTVELAITSHDDSSGVAEYLVSNDNFATSSSYAASGGLNDTKVISWKLPAGEGPKVVYVKAKDTAGNYGPVKTVSINYAVDSIVPQISLKINNGDKYTTSSLVTLSIIATDNYTDSNNLEMRLSNNGTSWTDWAPYAPVYDNFDINGGAVTETKFVFVQVRDENLNVGSAAATIGYVASGGEAAGTTDTAPVVVKSSMVSLVFSGLQNAAELLLSFDGANWGPPEQIPAGSVDYTTSTTFSSQGRKALYFKFRNALGQESQIIKKDYLVDYTPPVISLRTRSGARATSGNTIELQVKSSDNISPVNKLSYSITMNGSVVASGSSLAADGIISITLGAAGRKELVATVTDETGNTAQDSIVIWKL